MTEKKFDRLFPNVPKIIEASRGNGLIMRNLLMLLNIGCPGVNDMLSRRFAGCLQKEPCWPVSFEDLLRVEWVCGFCPFDENQLLSLETIRLLRIPVEAYTLDSAPICTDFVFGGRLSMDVVLVPELPKGTDIDNVNVGGVVNILGGDFVLLEITRLLGEIGYFASTDYVTPAGYC